MGAGDFVPDNKQTNKQTTNSNVINDYTKQENRPSNGGDFQIKIIAHTFLETAKADERENNGTRQR